MTETLPARLLALMETWRERAKKADRLCAKYEQGGDHAGNGHAFRKERRIWTTCADELEALLRDAAPQPCESENRAGTLGVVPRVAAQTAGAHHQRVAERLRQRCRDEHACVDDDPACLLREAAHLLTASALPDGTELPVLPSPSPAPEEKQS